MKALMNPQTSQKWERALLRTALMAGLALLAAQAWARVFLFGYVRQSVEERLGLVAILACAGLICCSLAAWVRPPWPGKRVLCIALALVAALSAFAALLPEILNEAIRN